MVKLINVKWALIFKNLADGPDISEEVLRAHWLAARDPVVRNWRRVRSIKEAFPRSKYVLGSTRIVPQQDDDSGADPLEHLFDEITRYVTELERCSVFAAEMQRSDAKHIEFTQVDRDRVRKDSTSLMRTNIVALFRPLLFACRLRHPKDGKLYGDVLAMCVNYGVRVFVINQRRGNAGETYLANLAHDLYTGKLTSGAVDEVRDLLWLYAPESAVIERLRAPENWYVRTNAHKFLLYEYEMSLVGSAMGVPPYHTFLDSKHGKSTEHILPQGPSKEPEPANSHLWWQDFTEREHEDLLNTLGNLVLTNGDSNSSYGRKPFVVKRGTPGQEEDCYFNGKLKQENEIANKYTFWTPATIRQRQSDLATWILSRWPVQAPTPAAVREVDSKSNQADGPED